MPKKATRAAEARPASEGAKLPWAAWIPRESKWAASGPGGSVLPVGISMSATATEIGEGGRATGMLRMAFFNAIGHMEGEAEALLEWGQAEGGDAWEEMLGYEGKLVRVGGGQALDREFMRAGEAAGAHVLGVFISGHGGAEAAKEEMGACLAELSARAESAARASLARAEAMGLRWVEAGVGGVCLDSRPRIPMLAKLGERLAARRERAELDAHVGAPAGAAQGGARL